MRTCPSSRSLIIDTLNRVLSFRFAHSFDAPAGGSCRVIPGGGAEDGGSFEQAAVKGLHGETGIMRQDIGTSVAEHTFQILLSSGETVLAQERFFVVHTNSGEISTEAQSGHERLVINDYRWWTPDELEKVIDVIFSESISTVLSEPEKAHR